MSRSVLFPADPQLSEDEQWGLVIWACERTLTGLYLSDPLIEACMMGEIDVLHALLTFDNYHALTAMGYDQELVAKIRNKDMTMREGLICGLRLVRPFFNYV